MARKITTRWKITGTLTAATPLHIGGVGGDADTDLALAVNGAGKYYVPGTSMAGALRGWTTQMLMVSQTFANDNTIQRWLDDPQNGINQYWGFSLPNQGHASFVLVEDAVIQLPQNADIEIREGVGIDRHSGTAAERCKYSRAIIPKGSTFPIHLTFDSQDQTGQLPDSLIQLLCALEAGDIRLGAAKTRGLGRIQLSQSQITSFAFDSPQGIFDNLLGQGQTQTLAQLQQAQNVTYQSAPYLGIEITWKPKDPVMVKAEGDGLAIDILPLVSQVGSDVRFVIPGSSIKGVLRTQAERIVRTLAQTATVDDFLNQLRLHLVNELFGSAGRGQDDPGKMGALAVDDCFSALPMTPNNWAAVENATEMTGNFSVPSPNGQTRTATLQSEIRNALGGNQNPYQVLQPAMHVAVDRWTGGAAEGMLYSVLEPIGVEWEPIQIHLDIARLQNYYRHKPDHLKPAIALLLLVLRDLANKKIPVGYGTNRGMGTIEVTGLTLNGKSLSTLNLDPLETMTCPQLTNLDPVFRDDLTNAWQQWIKDPAGLLQEAA
jgi:CRISPR/Cas system CSM-associated protein Csm3 (group 7 of RAMP superfamily)